MLTDCDFIPQLFAVANESVNTLSKDDLSELSRIVPDVEKLARYMEADETNGRFAHSPRSLEALIRYALGYGVGITGASGTGKTFFFKKLQSAIGRMKREGYALRDLQIIDLTQFGADNYGEILTHFNKLIENDLVFDDLGCEERYCKFGEYFFLLSRLLNTRLEHYSGRTYFTTNLSADELLNYYGSVRVIDRLKCLVGRMISFSGSSRRRARRSKVF